MGVLNSIPSNTQFIGNTLGNLCTTEHNDFCWLQYKHTKPKGSQPDHRHREVKESPEINTKLQKNLRALTICLGTVVVGWGLHIWIPPASPGNLEIVETPDSLHRPALGEHSPVSVGREPSQCSRGSGQLLV